MQLTKSVGLDHRSLFTSPLVVFQDRLEEGPKRIRAVETRDFEGSHDFLHTTLKAAFVGCLDSLEYMTRVLMLLLL